MRHAAHPSWSPSTNQVEAHVLWFTEHCRRLDEKKALLDRWREARTQQAAALLQVPLILPSNSTVCPHGGVLIHAHSTRLCPLRQGNPAEVGANSEESSGADEEASAREAAHREAAREAKRRAVEEWRLKRLGEAEAEAIAREEAEARRASETLRARQEQRAKQEAVALYKLEKEQRARQAAQVEAVLKEPTGAKR